MSEGDGRLGRRDILKKLGVGGAIAWSIPTIDAVMSPAAASTAAPFPSGGSALFTDATTPATSTPDAPVELGVVFVSSVAISVTGVGYFVPAGAAGPFVANLWDIAGTNLASAPDPITADNCWHEVAFGSPVVLTAGTPYVASYFSPGSGYAFQAGFYAAPLTVGPVTAPATSDPIAAPGNGRFAYSAGSTFPAGTFNANNYWVTPVWV